MKKKFSVVALMTVLSALFMSVFMAMGAQASVCTAGLGGGCGPYYDTNIPMSNGYNTYVTNQAVGANAGTTETLTSNNPESWNVVANAVPYGYGGVQTYNAVFQLTNDWNGSGWGGGSLDTPLNSLSSLTINYSESMPRDSNTLAEYAPDIWNDNYPNDVMFWVDTVGRCNEGAFGGTVLGTAVFGGQTWTVNRYGGVGAEIIFVLDSNPSVPNSCAQQTSGTIDIKAGFNWLVSHGIISNNPVLSQVNSGWEICSASNTSFAQSNYAIHATVSSQAQAPVVVTNAATAVTSTGATLNGSVNPEGQSTTYKFDYGTTTSYGTSVPSPAGSAGSGTSAVNESQPVTGLTANTTYHYRIEATNATGTTFGADQTFSTAVAGSQVLVGDTNVEANADNNSQGLAQAFPYTAVASGNSATIKFYVDASNTASAGDLGVYSDSSGQPGTLLGHHTFTPVAGWNTVTLTGVNITSGTTYWLAELGTTGVLAFRDVPSSPITSYTSSQSNLTALPATWSTGASWTVGNASEYVSS